MDGGGKQASDVDKDSNSQSSQPVGTTVVSPKAPTAKSHAPAKRECPPPWRTNQAKVAPSARVGKQGSDQAPAVTAAKSSGAQPEDSDGPSVFLVSSITAVLSLIVGTYC